MAAPTSEDLTTHRGMDIGAAPISMRDIAQTLSDSVLTDIPDDDAPPAEEEKPRRKIQTRAAAAEEGEPGVPEAEASPEPDEQELDEAAETEETEPETEAETEAEADETPDPDAPIDSIAALAQDFNIEESDFLENIMVTDSAGAEHSLGSVLETWQAAPNTIESARADLETGFQAQRTELREIHDQSLLQVAELTQALNQRFMANQLNRVEEMQLQRDEPDSYALYQSQQNEDRAVLQQSLQAIRAEADRREQSNTSERKAFLEASMAEVQKAWPALYDSKTATQVAGEMNQYLGGYGFKKEEIAEVSDPRIFRLIRDGMEGSQLKKTGQKKLAAARERGIRRPAPPAKARGEEATPGLKRQADVNTRREAHNQSKSVDSAALAIADIL